MKPMHSELAALAKKSTSSRFVLVSSSSSSELSDDSVTLVAALSEPAPSRKQKSIAKKYAKTRPSGGATERRKAPLPAASACVESSEPTVASAASASTARFGAGFDIDPATLPHYISVVGRKGADRSQKALYFNVKNGLSRFVQPGSEILVTRGISAVLGNATAALRELSRDPREFLSHFGIGEAATAFVHRAKMKLIVQFPRWLFRAYGTRSATPEEKTAFNFVRNLPPGMIVDDRLEMTARKIGKSAQWLDKSDDNLLSPQDIWDRIRPGLRVNEDIDSKLLVLRGDCADRGGVRECSLFSVFLLTRRRWSE